MGTSLLNERAMNFHKTYLYFSDIEVKFRSQSCFLFATQILLVPKRSFKRSLLFDSENSSSYSVGWHGN